MNNARRWVPDRSRLPSPTFTSSHLRDAESGLALAGLLVGVGAVAGLAQIPPARRTLPRRVPRGSSPSEDKRASPVLAWTGSCGVGSRRQTSPSGSSWREREVARLDVGGTLRGTRTWRKPWNCPLRLSTI